MDCLQLWDIGKSSKLEGIRTENSCTDESKKLKYEEHIQEFEMVQLIWSLCEILFIDVAPGGLVLTSLLDWLQWHFQEGKQLATKVIHSDQPCEHPQYWEAIYRLLLQGDTENVRKLLALNVYSHSDSFIAADEVLKKMPRWTIALSSGSAAI
uniref:Nuclear pore complex protein Nup85 n=1 Tax=Biomphalaria glabrata TaxID=6526 RepID=A0A2C9LCJ6_BIOGL